MLCCESLSEQVATRVSLPAPCEEYLPCFFRTLFGSGEPNILHDSEPISSLERNVTPCQLFSAVPLHARSDAARGTAAFRGQRDAIRLAPFASDGLLHFRNHM